MTESDEKQVTKITKERRGDEFQDPDELFTRSAHIWHTHTHSAMSAPVLCARCPCAAHAPPAQRSHPALCQHAAKFAFRPPFLCWLSLSLCNIVSQSNCFHSVPCSPVASATDLFSALTKVHDVLSMFWAILSFLVLKTKRSSMFVSTADLF